MTKRKLKPKLKGIQAVSQSAYMRPAVPLDPDCLYSAEETTDPMQFYLHPLPPRPGRDPAVKHDLSISLATYNVMAWKKQRKGESVRACLERLILEAPDAVEPQKPDPYAPSPYT